MAGFKISQPPTNMKIHHGFSAWLGVFYGKINPVQKNNLLQFQKR